MAELLSDMEMQDIPRLRNWGKTYMLNNDIFEKATCTINGSSYVSNEDKFLTKRIKQTLRILINNHSPLAPYDIFY